MDYYISGVLCAALLLILLGDALFDEPKEDFDKDLAKKEQHAEAQEVVDSMRGQLDYMRKDGLL